MSGTKIAMPQTNSFQSGALSFMSCTSGRESSPLGENDSHQTVEFKTETKKKRFHPLRNLRRMFRRKTRRSSISTESYQSAAVENAEITSSSLEQRSCSTSRLQEENLGRNKRLGFTLQTQNLMRNSRLNPGLSLSHDSIFTPDRADSGLSSSDLENSSLSITVLTPPSKECPMKSQSSCSETSLLSIGSSEVELSPVRTGKMSELDVGTTAYTLSHSAARHKMAVKPRRNHGAPRNRRRAMATKSPLPITPEVSEEGASGRNSPPLKYSVLDSPGLLSKCDKQEQDMKISWSDIAVDFNIKEAEDKGSVRTEDEADAKEEERVTQRTESFFGRFLSRRSEKKKKLLQESTSEESSDDRGNFVKKFSKNVDAKGMARKAPNRRQRVEPVEIPSSSRLNTFEIEKDKEELTGRKISGSVSPPKSHWSTQVTSRSMSPPKVIWSESASLAAKPDGASPTVSSRAKINVSPNSQLTENVLKDWKNPNFMKELTVSINSFAREKSAKLQENEEEEIISTRGQHSENLTPQKPCDSSENEFTCRDACNSSDTFESMKGFDEESVLAEQTPQPICKTVKTLHAFLVPYDAIHDGYENVKIIEEVKQEVMSTSEVQPVAEEIRTEIGTTEGVSEVEKPKPEGCCTKTDSEKPSLEKDAQLVKKVKPAVSDKPKDLKRTGNFFKTSQTQETKTPEESDVRNDNAFVKNKATLVERRKSELLQLTETEEKEPKTKVMPLQKQTSFSGVSTEREEIRSVEKTSSAQERESSAEKTESSPEIVEVVVLRKKSMSNPLEEQPELMKVFARRSLKVREGEKIMEEMQRSRDSDKENEVVDSPKEDRKKGTASERDEKKESENASLKEGTRVVAKEQPTEVKVVSITPLKPEVAFQKGVLHRYGRSLSENNGKLREEAEQKRESVVLEENKLNKIKSPMEKTIAVKLDKDQKEREQTDEEVEIGFKRIQQRKAEWERRAQQSAK